MPAPQRSLPAPQRTLPVLGLTWFLGACGVDNVPIQGSVAAHRSLDAEAGAASKGDVSGGASSGGANSGGARSGGTASAGGAGPDTARGQAWLTDPTKFYACQTEADTIEVRGVRDEACWLVVLARDVWPTSRCHPGPQTAPDWCVIEVQFSDTRAECQRRLPAPSGNYLSVGTVTVNQDLTLDLALDFTNPDFNWTSDVPFAVASCSATCSDLDCRG